MADYHQDCVKHGSAQRIRYKRYLGEKIYQMFRHEDLDKFEYGWASRQAGPHLEATHSSLPPHFPLASLVVVTCRVVLPLACAKLK